MEKVAFVFPGQGVQFVGMGKSLVEHKVFRDVFARAGGILNMDILSLCLKGPQAELDRTVNTQLAVLTYEVALLETMRALSPLTPAVLAGHSLGEYSALYASGALGLEDVLKLVRARARRHENGIPPGRAAMAAIVGIPADQVADLCRENSTEEEPVDLANLNTPIQVVVSGHIRAVERVMDKSKEGGAKMAVLLQINAPCHCRLLKPASELYRKDMENTTFKPFRVPVIPNCDPSLFYTEDNAKDLLRRQIFSPVRWQETVERMTSLGIKTVLEIGPKRVLSGLIKNINKDIRLFYAGDAETLLKAASAMTV